MDAQTYGDRTGARIRALAERQHGVVARTQLLALGVGRGAIEKLLRRGWLIPLHRGVYAVGHRQLRQEGRWLAVVLATGPGAVLSHRDAAALHRMRQPPDSARATVSTPAHVRAIEGVWVMARRRLTGEERTEVDGVPVTSPARTLVDLAPMLTAAQLQGTLGEADRRGLLDVSAIERALRRTKSRHGQGHARLRAALDAHRLAGTTLLRSELEARFLDLALEAGLPRPQLNAPVGRYEVDALWPDARLVVELDGWANHSDRRAAALDRDKTNRLQGVGYLVLRFMHGDLVVRPAEVAATIAGALRSRSGPT
ncbi:MAG TPA: type IV toxin-antitoxin system AbiEi family antitoxin domain-containing protein [Conexibacter sp.]